jgi:hypothetical protein
MNKIIFTGLFLTKGGTKMKTMLMTGIMLFGIIAISRSGEIPENPDRFPSIGINYTGSFASGEGKAMASGISATQDIEVAQGTFALDTRIPVSRSITLNGALGFYGYTDKAKETLLLAGQESNLGGLFLNIGVRFYIK